MHAASTQPAIWCLCRSRPLYQPSQSAQRRSCPPRVSAVGERTDAVAAACRRWAARRLRVSAQGPLKMPGMVLVSLRAASLRTAASFCTSRPGPPWSSGQESLAGCKKTRQSICARQKLLGRASGRGRALGGRRTGSVKGILRKRDRYHEPAGCLRLCLLPHGSHGYL